MLDHVDRGRVLEQPSGEDLAPGQRLIGTFALLDEDLDEGAGFGRAFPRRGALASCQLDRDIADPLGLAGLEDDVLGIVGPLVEQAECGHAVFHRGAVFAFHHRAGNGLSRRNLGHFGGIGLGPALPLAGGQRQRRQQQERAPAHQASGDHAS